MLANLKITVQTLLRLGVLLALVGWGPGASANGLKGTDGKAAGQTSSTIVNGGTTSYSAAQATAGIWVNPVADTPNLAVPDAITMNEDTSAALPITALLVDTDGSETLAVVISGVPSGAALMLMPP